MSSVCLTGWQQPADALADIAPNARHIDYSHMGSVDELFAALPREPKLLVGWSLGAQLAFRAVAEGHVRPTAMLLLAPSYQFIATPEVPVGMKREQWGGVVEHYRSDPVAMLRGFHMLVADGDYDSTSIVRTLNRDVRVWQQGLFWLEELGRFSCASLKPDALPPTMIVHGRADKVTQTDQCGAYIKRWPSVTLRLLGGCAHAPHLNDPKLLRSLVAEHV